ncbi:trafficking protein particle complex subunit 3 [Cylas formicarius]|uniref:trafficking protein particle complex subunit 3 n=1 Tax=Cylas formicarius TaxID=197179 RepID=UPI002958611E|nr:trafficking protein particle complex subunit 3 [Cylas formicarius]
MSRSTRFDPKKVNSELVTLTYGSLVAQMVKDMDNPDDVSKQLERIGYNMGIRLIEDFLSKTSTGRCLDLKDTADKIQAAFKLYLGVQPNVVNWSPAGDEFSFILDSNPFTELIELPEDLKQLKYCNIICGAIRGALEMVQLEVQSWIIQDQLKGDQNTEIRVKFIRRLEDAMPAGED